MLSFVLGNRFPSHGASRGLSLCLSITTSKLPGLSDSYIGSALLARHFTGTLETKLACKERVNGFLDLISDAFPLAVEREPC